MFNRTVYFYIVILLLIIVVVRFLTPSPEKVLSFVEFERILQGSSESKLVSAQISSDRITGKYYPDANQQDIATPYSVKILGPQIEQLTKDLRRYSELPGNKDFTYENEPGNDIFWHAMNMIVPVILLLAVWFFILRQMQIGGGKAMSFGKSRARLNQESGPNVTFDDVAGCEEAKEELQEIVEFLKDPRKFQRLGGRIPRGVLLIGPPGTGKTLLARAISGEANVPFFSISGSDFVEMFVGVGASRVRDLFEQGKKNAPCLIFIDEIDAVGRQRFAGVGGGHDEREQTLNQLLVEMDGFNSSEEVILIAATNRPDVLDPALLRPGRFDRQVTVDPPDLRGREAIFKVHTQNVVLADKVDLTILARRTPGFAGADIHNCVNEAALLAARNDRDSVEMQDFEEAIERVSAGPERRSRTISEHERKVIAYHEAGHAVVIHHCDEDEPVHKVSILPRGQALGYTMHMPTEDRYLRSRTDLCNQMTGLLGGRVAEEIIIKDITTGAQNDLERVTGIAHRMVCRFGMSQQLGPLTFGTNETQIFLGRDFHRDRDYSEEIAFEIDKEIRSLVDQCHARARAILEEHSDQLEALVSALLEKEVVSADEVLDLLEACVSDNGYTTRIRQERADREKALFGGNGDAALEENNNKQEAETGATPSDEEQPVHPNDSAEPDGKEPLPAVAESAPSDSSENREAPPSESQTPPPQA